MSLKVIITNVITGVISNVINLLFTPIDVSGLKWWSKNEVVAISGRNEAAFQLNNEANAAVNGKLFTGSGINLVSATSDQVTFGNVGTVKAIEFWIKLGSTTEKVIDLNGTANIEVVTGTITLNNWAGATIKVNDVVSSTLDTNWKHVLISSATGISASAFKVANIASSFGDFAMKDLIAYSAEKATSNYNTPQAIGSVTDALILARFSETKNLDNGAALNEGTSGNGTVLTTGATTYDMSINGLADGFQLGLSGYNRYDEFNGTDSLINTNQASPLISDTFEFDFDLFIYNLGTDQYYLQFGSNQAVAIAIRANGSLNLFLGGFSIDVDRVNWNNLILNTDLKKITNIKLSWNGTTVTLQKNGVIVTSSSSDTPTAPSITSTSNMLIGGFSGMSASGFVGFISKASITINGVSNTYIGTFNEVGVTKSGTFTKLTIPSTTPEGSTDYLANIIGNLWRKGTINLGAYGHLGAQIGSTNSAIDADNRSFIFLIDYANNGASQYLLSNRADDDGLDVRLNVNDKFLVANEVSGAFLSTDVAASVYEEKTRILVTLALNGDCAVYIETLGTAFNTAYTSKNLGAPGGGSAQPKLGIKSDNTDPFTGPINYIQVNSVIDLATANQLADYMEIQFSKI